MIIVERTCYLQSGFGCACFFVHGDLVMAAENNDDATIGIELLRVNGSHATWRRTAEDELQIECLHSLPSFGCRLSALQLAGFAIRPEPGVIDLLLPQRPPLLTAHYSPLTEDPQR